VFYMTVRVFKGGSFEREHEIDQMENVLEHIYKEFQNDVGQFAFFIDIEINGRKLDGLLIIEHPKEEERNVVVVIELKNISGNMKANLDLENEKWLEKTERGTSEVLTYKNGKKIKPLTQCKKNSKEVAELLKKSLEEEDHDEVEFWQLFPLISSITILPDDAIFKLENYSSNLKKWFNVINEKDIAKRITKLRKGCDLSIPFEDAIKLLKKHATKPDSKQRIKELKTEKEINQFWRDFKESKDVPEQKTEPEISYPQIKTALSSNNKQDIEYAFEVINFLELNGHKDEILSLRKHRDFEIRKITLENLDKWLDGKELTMEILKYVDDECVGVWRKADELMYAYGTRSARPKYNYLIKNSNYFDRVYSALDVLKSIGNEDTLDILIDLHNDFKSRFEEEIRREKKWEIITNKEITDDERKNQIEKETDSKLKTMESKILDTIKNIGGPKVIPFAKSLLDETLDEYHTLERLKDGDIEKIGDVQNKIIYAIGLFGRFLSEDAIPLLKKAFEDSNDDSLIQTKVVDALVKLDHESGNRFLVDLIKDKNSDDLLQLKAIKHLGEAKFEESLDFLHHLVENKKPTEYLGMDERRLSMLEIGVIDALGNIGSKSSFDILYQKYVLNEDNYHRMQVNKALFKIDKDLFEEKLFEILRKEDIVTTSIHMDIIYRSIKVKKGELHSYKYHIDYQPSRNRIGELVNFFMDDIDRIVLLDDGMVDKIYDSLPEGDLDEKNMEKINKIVKDANITDPYEKTEKIDDIHRLVSISYPDITVFKYGLSYLLKEYGELPERYVDMLKGYITSDKPNLRKLGLELLDSLYSHEDFKTKLQLDIADIIDMRKNDKIVDLLRKVFPDDRGFRTYLIKYDVHTSIIRCLGRIGNEEAVSHLFDYLERDDILREGVRLHPAFVQLEGIMNSEGEIGKNHGKKKGIPIPDWILHKAEDSQRYCKFIAYYWENKAIELFKGYIEDGDNTLKLHVCHSLSYLKFEEIKPLLKRLILDPNPRVRGVAINTYMYITGKKLYTNDVIRKAEADEL